MLQMTVEKHTLPFMVDTGARYSTLTSSVQVSMLSDQKVPVVGFSGTTSALPLTRPLQTTVGSQTFLHSFLFSPDCPVNLLGRDIMCKTGMAVSCLPEGTEVIFPDGQILKCGSSILSQPGQMVLQSSTPTTSVDIYWALLQPETVEKTGILSLFQSWKPWLLSLHPYSPPTDPLHVTLNYTREMDFIYHDAFEEEIAGTTWSITSPCLLVGKEGVVAAVDLTPDQMSWYRLSSYAAPHVSLALHPGHQAKDLGPMTKRLLEAQDWKQSTLPQVLYSPSQNAYKIMHHTTDKVILEHQELDRFHGREHTDHPATESMLNSLPTTLWSEGPTDVGFCSRFPPVQFSYSTPCPIWRCQYPLKEQSEAGIADTIAGLERSGVLEPAQTGAWNTPILPVPKPNSDKYRMVHDLRPINAIVTTPCTPVPNPYTALSSITPEHKFFSTIDLANAFFCLPLHPSLRELFAFTFRGRRYQYTRLPQGFVLSPGIFNQALRSMMSDLVLPPGVVLIQYVDDVLLAARTDIDCLTATHAVLTLLGNCGFKVSRAKLACCRPTVYFLGRVIFSCGSGISPSHLTAILHHKKPETVKDMLSFLGLTGYSRHFVACYVENTSLLRQLVSEQGHRNLTATLKWTPEAEAQFISLKQILHSATMLAIPDYSLPFFLDVSEKSGVVNAVLFQKKGGGRKVLLYYSSKLDSVENSQTPCIKFAAAVAKAIQKTAHIVMHHPLTVLTTHSVATFVSSKAFSLTHLRQTRLEKILLQPHITYSVEGVNIADNMNPFPEHKCEEKSVTDTKVREDLQTEPLTGPVVRQLFTDGCCYRDKTGNLPSCICCG